MSFFSNLKSIRPSTTHEIIWETNSKKGASVHVRVMTHWCKEQTMHIKWGKHLSEPFRVSNGVRQGGRLSPNLFVVYLNDLSNELTKQH